MKLYAHASFFWLSRHSTGSLSPPIFSGTATATKRKGHTLIIYLPTKATKEAVMDKASKFILLKRLSGASQHPSQIRRSCSLPSNLDNDFQASTAIDYRSLLQEDDFHRLANSTIHDLQEKFENEILTLKLGALDTYVLNKQTPNRQIWMSSPVSGPSRFNWDQNSQAWVYRRTKANLLKVLESDLEQLCGEPISLFLK